MEGAKIKPPPPPPPPPGARAALFVTDIGECHRFSILHTWLYQITDNTVAADRRLFFPAFVQIKVFKKSKKISNDQELIQSDPISCPQNQKGNN